jgi:microcystin-dependent protein
MQRIVGRIMMWAGEISQKNLDELEIKGWLLCDGRQISQSRFHELFDVIHDNFKITPDEVLNPGEFRLPDFRGRTAIGSGQSDDLSNRELGHRVGEEEHQLSLDEMPRHSHPTIQMVHNNADDGVDSVRQHSFEHNNHLRKTEDAGNDKPHNNMQPSLAINYLILWKSS